MEIYCEYLSTIDEYITWILLVKNIIMDGSEFTDDKICQMIGYLFHNICKIVIDAKGKHFYYILISSTWCIANKREFRQYLVRGAILMLNNYSKLYEVTLKHETETYMLTQTISLGKIVRRIKAYSFSLVLLKNDHLLYSLI
jgi:hypothetical protein